MKNLLLVYVILLGCFSANAQEFVKKFRIEGHIKGLETPDGKMYLRGLVNANGVNQTDTVEVHDGRFSFSGETEPTCVKIYSKRVGYPNYINPMDIFVGEGNIYVEAIYDTTEYTFLRDVKVKGSPLHDESVIYNRKLTDALGHVDFEKLQKDYMTAQEKRDTTALRKLNEINDELSTKLKQAMDDFIRDNPTSFVSMHVISEISRATGEYLALAKKWFGYMNASVKSSLIGKRIAKNLEYASKGELIGKPAGDFEQPTADGKPVRLSDYRGKYVLLDFWASWNKESIATQDSLVPVQKALKKNKFVIISLSLDLDKKEWMEKIIQRDTTQWKQVCDFKGWDNSIVKQQGITRIPANILIGPDKRVITQDIRGKELIDKVKQLIEQDKEKEKAAKEAERTRKRQNKK